MADVSLQAPGSMFGPSEGRRWRHFGYFSGSRGGLFEQSLPEPKKHRTMSEIRRYFKLFFEWRFRFGLLLRGGGGQNAKHEKT